MGELVNLTLRSEHFDHSLSDLFGLHSVDNRVKQGRNKQVKVGQQNMYIRSNIEAKSVYEGCKKGENIELKKDKDVGCAGVECFESGLLLWQLKHSLEDEGVG